VKEGEKTKLIEENKVKNLTASRRNTTICSVPNVLP